MTHLEKVISALYRLKEETGYTDWTVENLKYFLSTSVHPSFKSVYVWIWKVNEYPENVFRLLVEQKAIASADLKAGLDNINLHDVSARVAVARYRKRIQVQLKLERDFLREIGAI